MPAKPPTSPDDFFASIDAEAYRRDFEAGEASMRRAHLISNEDQPDRPANTATTPTVE